MKFVAQGFISALLFFGVCCSDSLSCAAAAAASERPEIFDLSGLDATPKKKAVVEGCLQEISANPVGARLLQVLGERLREYYQAVHEYNVMLEHARPLLNDAFFAHVRKKIDELAASSAEAAATAEGTASGRGTPASESGSQLSGRATPASGASSGRVPLAQLRQAMKGSGPVAVYTERLNFLKQLFEEKMQLAMRGFFAAPPAIAIVDADETCFNYGKGMLIKFIANKKERKDTVEIGRPQVKLDFGKIYFKDSKPTSLTACLGCRLPDDRLPVGVHYAPYYLTIAHELVHAKHFLESIVDDIRATTMSIRIILEALSANGATLLELRDIFPSVSTTVEDKIEDFSYLKALTITSLKDFDGRYSMGDYRLLKEEELIHVAVRCNQLWPNLEERRTVVGPDGDGISELTLRFAAGVPIRYLYQDSDTHLFEDAAIIERILARNNTATQRLLGRTITLRDVERIAGTHEKEFIFKQFYAGE